jgi:multidrug resistance protein, MATE family
MSQSAVSHSIKSELKSTISLGTPLVFSRAISACTPFITTAMIARLGQDALAASILVFSAYMALSILFFAMFDAVGVLISHQHGAKNEKAISEIMGQAFLLVAVTCILLMVILACAPYFLSWHTQPLRVVQLAHEYLRSLLWTLPGLMGWIVILQYLASTGHTKLIFVSNLINIPLEILLIYLLIFGKFGLPDCGIAGVGYGLAVSYTLALMVIIGYLSTSKYYRKLNLFAEIGKIQGTYLKELIRVGLPMGFMGFIEMSAFAIITLWMARFGTTMLAAHQILMQYLFLFVVMVFAMAQTVAIRVGHATGRQDLSGVHYATYVGVALSFFCTLFLVAAFYFFPQIFLSLDINTHDPVNTELVQIATQFLSILSVFLLVESIRLTVGFGALRGLKDVHFTMLASLLAFWIIGLTASFLLGFVFHLTGAGLWWGLTLGIAIGTVVVIIRWYNLVRRIDLAKLLT